MKLYEAEVVNDFDYTKSGKIQVSSTDFPGIKTAIYTSPYGSMYNPLSGKASGFFGIPCRGRRVLVAQTENEKEFYFISVIHIPDFTHNEDTILSMVGQGPVPNDVYRQYGGNPGQMVVMDPYGNRLTLAHAYSPEPNKETNKAEISSGLGKRLALIDSPLINKIVLETELNDGIEITSIQPNPVKGLGPNHMLLHTKGVMQQFADAAIDIVVVDGLELNIENKSTTYNSTSGVQSGNVNIKAHHKDVNITAMNASKNDTIAARVMIRAKGAQGLVQINSDGSVIIKAPNDQIFIEGSGINIKSSSNVNIEAADNVNIRAGGRATMSGSTAVLNLEEDAALDGNFVYLAPGGGVPAADGAESADNITNSYGD